MRPYCSPCRRKTPLLIQDVKGNVNKGKEKEVGPGMSGDPPRSDLGMALYEDPWEIVKEMQSYQVLRNIHHEKDPQGWRFGKYQQGTKEFWFIYAHRRTSYAPPRDGQGKLLKLSKSQHFAIFQQQVKLHACALLTDPRCVGPDWERPSWENVDRNISGCLKNWFENP